jgi:cytoskeletal protein RodZ
MKKILLLVVVLLLLAAIVGLRVYQNRAETPAEPQETEAPVPEAAEETPEPTPEPTPYDPAAVLDLENADLDEETRQDILQIEEEWAAEGPGVGQLSPADPSDDTTVITGDSTIQIGEGETGSLGF